MTHVLRTTSRQSRLAAAVLGLALAACSEEPTMPSEATSGDREAPGIALRAEALGATAGELGFSPDEGYPSVYGVLTDWNLGEQTATILAMRDGTASLYTTSSFGIIGGRAHARVRAAAQENVRAAEVCFGLGEPVTEFPYPPDGAVYFYLLTYDGVRRCAASEESLEGGGAGPLAELFGSAQAVLTELKEVAESGSDSAGRSR